MAVNNDVAYVSTNRRMRQRGHSNNVNRQYFAINLNDRVVMLTMTSNGKRASITVACVC